MFSGETFIAFDLFPKLKRMYFSIYFAVEVILTDQGADF